MAIEDLQDEFNNTRLDQIEEQWENIQATIASVNVNKAANNESPIKANLPPPIQPNGAILDILTLDSVDQISAIMDSQPANLVHKHLQERCLRLAPNKATEQFLKRVKDSKQLLIYIQDAEEKAEPYADEAMAELLADKEELTFVRCLQPSLIESTFKSRIELEAYLLSTIGPPVLGVAWDSHITVTLTEKEAAETLVAGLPQIPQGVFTLMEEQSANTFRNYVAGPFPSSLTPEEFKRSAPGNPLRVYMKASAGKTFAFVLYGSIQEAVIAKRVNNGIFSMKDKLYKMQEALGGQGIGKVYKLTLHARKQLAPKVIAKTLTNPHIRVDPEKLIDIALDFHSDTGNYMGKVNIKVAGIKTHDMLLKTRFQVKSGEVCRFSTPATSAPRVNRNLF